MAKERDTELEELRKRAEAAESLLAEAETARLASEARLAALQAQPVRQAAPAPDVFRETTYWKVKVEHGPTWVVEVPGGREVFDCYKAETGMLSSPYPVEKERVSEGDRKAFLASRAPRP